MHRIFVDEFGLFIFGLFMLNTVSFVSYKYILVNDIIY